MPGNHQCESVGAVVNGECVIDHGSAEAEAVQKMEADRRSDVDHEVRGSLALDLLKIINEGVEEKETIRRILHAVKEALGCDAIGVRLREGRSYPFYESDGYPDGFFDAAGSGCAIEDGPLDSERAPSLSVFGCLCGVVPTGIFDTASPFFTSAGSFWTNGLTQHLGAVPLDVPSQLVGDRCVTAGYESIAVIPLRAGDEVVGILQINDSRPDFLSAELVEFAERAGQALVNVIQRRPKAQAYRRLEDETRGVLDAVPEIALTVQVGSEIVSWANGAAREYYGSDIIGKRWSDFVRLDDLDRTRAALDRALISRSQFAGFQNRVRRADGDYRDISWRAVIAYDENGRPLRIQGLGTDITEVVRGRPTAAGSRCSAGGADHVNEPAIGVALDGSIATWNPPAEALFGYSAAEVTGRNIRLFVPRSQRRELVDAIAAAASGQPVPRYDTTLRKKDGSRIDVASSICPVLTDDGTVAGCTITVMGSAAARRPSIATQHAYDRERRIAETLQGSLLTPVPKDFPGYHIDTVYQAALDEARVGGDFYDVFRLDENRIAVVIGDVSGKGLQAAVEVAMAKYSVRTHAYEQISPSRVLEHANRALSHDLAPDRFVTLFLGVLDSSTKVLTYANAGHTPPLLRRASDGSLEELRPTGMLLGTMPDATYAEHGLRLEPDDALLLCTDGVTEARCGGAMLEAEGLAAMFAEVCDRGLCTADAVFAKLWDYCRYTLRDDVVIVTVNVRPG